MHTRARTLTLGCIYTCARILTFGCTYAPARTLSRQYPTASQNFAAQAAFRCCHRDVTFAAAIFSLFYADAAALLMRF